MADRELSLEIESPEPSGVLPDFRKISIRPLDCIREAGTLVKGQYLLFVGITTVGFLLGAALPFALLMGPMLCGYYFCFRERTEGRRVNFVQLFRGFNHFVQALIAYLIQVGAALVAIVPVGLLVFLGLFVAVGLAERSAPAPLVVAAFVGAGVTGLILALLWLLVIGLFVFSHQLILDRGLTALEAVRCSCQAAWANAAGVLGLVIVTSLMTLLATLFCYIPMFFVLPLVFGSYWIAYQKVFPPRASDPAAAVVA